MNQNIVMAHSFVKLTGSKCFGAYHLFVIDLSESPAFYTFADKRIESHKSASLISGLPSKLLGFASLKCQLGLKTERYFRPQL